jgi:choline dehydrogenase-like flavoprotein
MKSTSETKRVFDAIIVGSGAAGAWAAMDLTQGGMNVLLLEAGRDIDTRRDFPISRREGRAWSLLACSWTGQRIQARGPSFQLGLRHFYVVDRENPYSAPDESPFLWIRGRQLGGRMHTWARTVLRMSEHELTGNEGSRSPQAVWPISYRDLSPFYDKVEQTLGVLGNRDGLENLPDGKFEGPPPVSPASQLFARWIENRTGIRVIRNRVVRYNPDRLPLPLKLALRTDRLEIQTDSVVGHILIDEKSGNAAGLGYYNRRSKLYNEAFGKVIVLCASAFESVRILLNSACDAHPSGIGASSGCLGRYVGDHVMFGVGGKTSAEFARSLRAAGLRVGPTSRDPYDFGAYSMYIPNFCGNFGNKPDFIGGYGIQCGATTYAWWMLAFGEMVPRFENRVSVLRRKRDAWGIPIAHITVSHSTNEEKMVAHMEDSINEIVTRVGFSIEGGNGKPGERRRSIATRSLGKLMLQDSGAFLPGASVHETGGARMGRDPSSSVLNSHCQCWDVPNVFVTDGACFPSSGYQNHTLTIMALTARACAFILHKYS